MTINKLNGTECGTEIAKKINTIIDEKASVSLDNLDTDGQAIIDGKVSSSDLFDENEHIKINKLQSYSLPSSSYIDLTLGPSGSSYTAPANGWFVVWASMTSQTYIQGTNTVNATGFYHITPTGMTIAGRGLLPVRKGDVMTFLYNANVEFIRFIYAVGSAPQT